MEKYIVDVFIADSTIHTPWWHNFLSSLNGAPWYPADEFYKILSNHNAANVQNTNYIAFDTEEDFLMFKLKFS